MPSLRRQTNDQPNRHRTVNAEGQWNDVPGVLTTTSAGVDSPALPARMLSIDVTDVGCSAVEVAKDEMS